MLNIDFLKHKVNLIVRDLDRLNEFRDMTYDDVAKDWRSFHIVERLLEQIITRAIDLNRHIIAEIGTGRERVTKHEETFIELGSLGVLEQSLAEQIAPSAGLRNRLVHEYNDTKPEIIFASVKDALKQYTAYCDAILKFVEKQG